MRGRTIRQSPEQRGVIDLLRYAVGMPSYTDGRRMNISAVVAARAQSKEKPRWLAIFAKACAMVSQEMPKLRCIYLAYPWPRIYQYPTSAATIMVARDHEGERTHFPFVIKDPASIPLVDINRHITHAATAPANEVKGFRRSMTFAALPSPLRRLVIWLAYNMGSQRARYFGTFALTFPPPGRVYGWLSAWTCRYTYGTIGSDGMLDITVTVDHRVIDGVTGMLALKRLEEVLNGPIADELRRS